MTDWEERARAAQARFEDGTARLPDDRDERQRQLTRMGNAAWAAGLALLMLGRREDARAWLVRAADTYRESWPDAPAGSWGRPIGALKSRLIAGDLEGAREDARWALDAEAAESVRGADSIPPAVVESLAALAARDAPAYEAAIRALAADFETREAHLEDMPVADTVLALQALAAERWIVLALESPVLPA
jgi:hypothetical protein